jgi:hypothetical protein
MELPLRIDCGGQVFDVLENSKEIRRLAPNVYKLVFPEFSVRD